MIKYVMSFGFRYGKPDGYEVWDARWLPNPHNHPELRELDGRDERIKKVVMKFKDADDWIEHIIENSTTEFVAVGCIGGKHRSVAIAEILARRTGATVFHRELE